MGKARSREENLTVNQAATGLQEGGEGDPALVLHRQHRHIIAWGNTGRAKVESSSYDGENVGLLGGSIAEATDS